MIKLFTMKDFIALLGRACEYAKDLEALGKTKKGIYMPLYESVCNDARKAIDENWAE